MRPFDIIRQKKRYEMFNEKSKDTVIELNAFFGKYLMHFEERVNKTGCRRIKNSNSRYV